MEQAKERAKQFIDDTIIEGESSSDAPIITNLDYLRDNLKRLLTF